MSSEALPLRADATYLITGGLGGVASEIAGWMVEQGARHLVLVSRRTPASEERAWIAALESGGAQVCVMSADVSQWTDIAGVFGCIDSTMPPLAGVVHAAAVVDDALLADVDSARFSRVLGAKADGAWHLHGLTRDRRLDFFVMCSSIAASIVQPGQASYAAANTFLDALAWYRRSLGLPALSIQWGLWADTGLARRAGTMRSFNDWARQGVGALTPAVAVKALAHALRVKATAVLVAPIDRARFTESRDGDDARGLFARLVRRSQSSTASTSELSLLDRVRMAGPDARRTLVRQCLREQLGQVMRIDADRIDPERPLGTVGLDSLLTVEFTRRVSAALGLRLAATAVFSYPTLAALETEIVGRLEPPSTPQVESAPEQSEVASSGLQQAVADMSEEDTMFALMGNLGAGR